VHTSGDLVSAAFEESFPGIKVEVLGDLSKYLDGRINRIYQTSHKEDNGADVVVIQSLHNFPLWKRQNRLLNYKPINWDDIYPEFVDEDGAYAGYYICTSPLPFSSPQHPR
jgi:ABC-type Fe3+ transport system substrate-binding protein